MFFTTLNYKSTLDLFLTNKPRSFQFTSVTETGLSDYHRLITTFSKSHFSRLTPKIIHYHNYKRFDEQKFTAFVTKDLRKAIYTRSRLKNKFIKNPSEINKKLHKRQRNKCVSISKKST